jgi:uncharacterized membrane protein YphA (DoxX/SURF4 family)
VINVQRLYSGFPSALPGIGLLLLRVTLAVSIANGAMRALGSDDAASYGAVGVAYRIALLVLSIPMAVGFLTPIVHVIVAIVESAAFAMQFSMLGSSLVQDEPYQTHLLRIAIAIALALIGPGAFSADSRLFGRRQIILQPRGARVPQQRVSTRK